MANPFYQSKSMFASETHWLTLHYLIIFNKIHSQLMIVLLGNLSGRDFSGCTNPEFDVIFLKHFETLSR